MSKQKNINSAYGKPSCLSLKFCCRLGKTLLNDVYFTAPFKVMQPFCSVPITRYMILTASAGIMSGDQQKITICLQKGTSVELTSQSYEKIHKMPDGEGRRSTRIILAENTLLFYMPQPVIPFAESAFASDTVIHLTDNTAKLFYSEILSSGRTEHKEHFLYKKYTALLKVYEGTQLCYFENTRYFPDQQKLASFGFYERYTHLATILLFNFENVDKLIKKIREFINTQTNIDSGVSLLSTNHLCIKAFAYSSEILVDLIDLIKNMLKPQKNYHT
ncbi:urease accessory protein UreD [Pectinatus frisingensis]|jgi:urease accessory protein|uniref:urease accessory protein UreD n=1 Tax=Pectinatus frisingensis TaxID=865 RepID=UPI0015F6F077|nr:urease accessory protein UreD [Pectinatus frisingensis]